MDSNWQTNIIIQAGNRRNNDLKNKLFQKNFPFKKWFRFTFVVCYIMHIHPHVNISVFVKLNWSFWWRTVIREQYWVHFHYIITDKGIISCTIFVLRSRYKGMDKYLSTPEAVVDVAFCFLKKNIII